LTKNTEGSALRQPLSILTLFEEKYKNPNITVPTQINNGFDKISVVLPMAKFLSLKKGSLVYSDFQILKAISSYPNHPHNPSKSHPNQ
jgi:hypothetical protein